MCVKAFRDGQELLIDQAKRLVRDLRVDLRTLRAVKQVLAGDLLRHLKRRRFLDPLLQLLVLSAELVPDLLLPSINFVARHHASLCQLCGVQLTGPCVPLNLGVHLRLRVGRFVGLVVTEAPVANQVDQNVMPKLGSVGHR